MTYTDMAHSVVIRFLSRVMGTLICLVLGLTVHGFAWAQEEIVPPDVLASLDDSDLTQRENATQQLETDDLISSGAIEELLVIQRDELTFEQIDRLIQTLEHRTLGEIAVLGIEMRRGVVPIEIERIFMGAPANRVLRFGDKLQAVDGQTLDNDQAPAILQQAVTQKGVGDRVTLEIERDGETMRVRVELADAYTLRGFSTDRLERDRANLWLAQRRRLVPPPIGLAVVTKELEKPNESIESSPDQ